MDSLKKLIDVCNEYKNGEYGVEEFQKRIETVYLPDEYKYSLEKKQHNAFNDLEEIIYFFPESEQRERGIKVAEELIQATIIEKDRLKKVNS